MNRQFGVTLLRIFVGLLLCHASAQASWNDVESGTLLVQFDGSEDQWVAPTLASDVELSVSGPIVRAVVRQTFHNPGDEWAEAVYVFPLPETAAVDHMWLEIGERIIEGQIKEKAAAKKIYNAAKRQGKQASLVEQERPNMFTTSVANIPPGESVKVVIEYQHPVDKDGDLYSLRFPMTITPRYIPGTRIDSDKDNAVGQFVPAVADASRVTPPWGLAGKNHNPTRVQVDLQPGFIIDTADSVHHRAQVETLASDRRLIRLEPGAHQANADFVLHWRPLGTENPQAAFFTEQRDGETYSLLMVSPPGDYGAAVPMAREVIYVIDTSGSMGGESIRQAKRALLWALGRLNSEDNFNIIEFNSDTWKLFERAQPATGGNIRKARRFVEQLQARGGTEMLKAIEAALCLDCRATEKLRQVIFLTDGAIGNEGQLLQSIDNRLGDSRLFTVGIGSAPNSYFMRKAAVAGRGHFTYIADVGKVGEAMAQLFAKIEAPLMTNIEVYGGDGERIATSPDPIADLYAGQPLVVMIEGQLPDQLMVSGDRGDETWQQTLNAEDAVARPGVHVLWARNQIEQLMDQRRYSRVPDDRQGYRDEIVRLSLRHHLVSAFTSLVAVDVTPVKPLDAPSSSHTVPTNSPEGTRFGLTRTATPAGLQIQLGLLLLILGVLLWFGGSRRLRRVSVCYQ